MKGSQSSYYDKQYSVDNPVSYVLLSVAPLLLWTIGYKSSAGYPLRHDASSTPLWEFICLTMTDKTVIYIAGALLTVGSALLLFRTNYLLMLIREKTIMPFLLFILFVSSDTAGFPLNSATAGVLCLTLAFYQLFVSYHDSGAILRAFNVGLLLGLGSLLWTHVLWFVPVFWWGMYSFNTLSLRTFLATVAGAGAIYWFLLGWYVIRHDFTPLDIRFDTLPETVADQGGVRALEWAKLLFVAFLSVISIANILLHEHDDSLRTRKYLFFLIVFLTITSVLFFLYDQFSGEFLNIACIPMSILVAHFFTVQKGKRILWFYYTMIVTFILLSLFSSSWIFLLNMGI
ncbi:MAG: DUF6427 family protein [Tannerellaceae bacterium]|jgi:hypothetical protein|nr:DUF6427 family protein [Tannerellaceae bacterium]